MKITKLGYRNGKLTVRTLEDEELLALLRAESTREQTEKFRDYISPLTPSSAPKFIERMPKALFGGVFERKNENLELVEYNGCVLLQVKPINTTTEAVELRKRIAAYPQTRWAMIGADSKSVNFVVPYTRPDGTLPQTAEEAEKFHAHAYQHAVKTYEPRISYPIAEVQPSVSEACVIGHDAEAYYNANALPIHLEQPTAMPTGLVCSPTERPQRPESLGETWYDRQRYVSTQYELALSRAIAKHGELTLKMDFKPLLVALGKDCHQAGIPEEDTVKWTMLYLGELLSEVEIRETMHNLYDVEEGFASVSIQKKEQFQALRIEEFMRRRYEFRKNVMCGIVEYRERGSFRFDFRPITEEVQNSITMNAQLEGLTLWDRDVKRYIHSDRVADYSPIDDYLAHLPKWDGQDHIRALANRVKCDNPRWGDLFYRWFLGMVAYWQQRDTKHANSASPLLVGPQGIDKSTFCREILPPELGIYFTDDLDFSEKRHALLYLNRFALINLDEFDQIGVRHQGFLKHLLQKPSLNVRRPNSAYIEKVRRYASFIATSNHTDLLNDPSGSRRFICVHVSEIDNSQPIDYGQLYAQAIALLDAGERYWFTREEGEQQTESNREFQQQPLHEQLFHQYFRAATEEEEGRWMLAVEVAQYLQKKSRMKLAINGIRHFGRFLSKQNLPTRRTSQGTQYRLAEREQVI